MTAYDVTLSGCDDSTRLFDLDLAADDVALLERVAELSRFRGGGCQPTMTVARSPQAPVSGTCGDCFEPFKGERLARDRYGEWCHAHCVIGGSS